MNISILERGPRFLELAFRFLIVWSLEALETVHLQLIMLHQTTLDLEYYVHIFQNLHQFAKIISSKSLLSPLFIGTIGTCVSPSGWNLGNCLTSIWQIFSLWSPCSCTTCRWVYSSSIFHQMETTVFFSKFVWNNFFHTPVMQYAYPLSSVTICFWFSQSFWCAEQVHFSFYLSILWVFDHSSVARELLLRHFHNLLEVVLGRETLQNEI